MYALVTEKYAPHDADEIAAEIARLIPSECRGDFQYLGDGGRFEVNAELARPFKVRGDLHKIIITVRSSDNGSLGQRVFFKAFRQKCTNGIAVVQKSLILNTRHVGDRSTLQKQFQRGIAMAGEAIESFTELWGTAQTSKYLCAETGNPITGDEALKRLVMQKQVHVPHNRRKALLERCMGSFEKEPGDSIADVLNAVTRTAHESLDKMRSEWFGVDLEEQAGVLLSQGQRNLRPLTEKEQEILEGKSND